MTWVDTWVVSCAGVATLGEQLAEQQARWAKERGEVRCRLHLPATLAASMSHTAICNGSLLMPPFARFQLAREAAQAKEAASALAEENQLLVARVQRLVLPPDQAGSSASDSRDGSPTKVSGAFTGIIANLLEQFLSCWWPRCSGYCRRLIGLARLLPTAATARPQRWQRTETQMIWSVTDAASMAQAGRD